jgi:hypothetical protein
VGLRGWTTAGLCAAGAASLLVASLAIAGSTRTTTVTVPDGTTVTAAAKCRHHSKVTLDGFKSDLKEQGPLIHPSQMTRPTARSVRVGAAAQQGFTAGKLTAIAYCGREPRLHQKTKAIMVAPGEQTSVTAKCQRGSSVRLGGFRAQAGSMNGEPNVVVDGLERTSASRWQASAINLGSASGSLESVAYCGKGSPNLDAVKKSIHVPGTQVGAVTARCPRHESIVMGGFDSEHYDPTTEGTMEVNMLARTSRRSWKVRALKFQPLLGRLTAIAYCG